MLSKNELKENFVPKKWSLELCWKEIFFTCCPVQLSLRQKGQELLLNFFFSESSLIVSLNKHCLLETKMSKKSIRFLDLVIFLWLTFVPDLTQAPYYFAGSFWSWGKFLRGLGKMEWLGGFSSETKSFFVAST